MTLSWNFLGDPLSTNHDISKRERQARLRFSIIGVLFAAPPANGDLLGALRALTAKPWRDPVSGLEVRLCFRYG